MGDKYCIEAAGYPFKGWYDEMKVCETLEECVEAIKDFQKRGLWIINVKIRDCGGEKQ